MAKSKYLIIFVACLAVSSYAEEEERYPDKYDHLDVDAILENDRLRNQYYKCFLDTAPCVTADAIFFKERIPEAIVTKCRKCTDKQKEAFNKIAIWFDEHDREGWEAIIRKAVSDFQKKALLRKMIRYLINVEIFNCTNITNVYQTRKPTIFCIANNFSLRTMVVKVLLLLALCALVTITHADEEIYSNKYDFVDVDSILKNDRLRNQYYECFQDIAPCLTPDAKFFKDKIPEALVTKCRKCTDRQKYMFERIVTYYTENEPDKWALVISNLIKKYEKKHL
ncbi:uncharacterized protein LOC131669181 [Phymastichus coffea]|uniref:uncharacterized protein LOC131669181 n=1 Tax=Phymastichus coffea TaxID=108790 RepID=UPI00273CC5E5|nr:uncharacterized protein LOC131669181 [Phymastichus coffea]